MNYFIRNITVLLIFISTLPFFVSAEQPREAIINCAPQFQNCMEKILKIPELKQLLTFIKKDGAIHILPKHSELTKQFGAFWDPDRRIIYVDIIDKNEGLTIGSIIFELHNASVNAQIIHLNKLASQGKINKENYIESMEHIEYINSINASKIASKGIKKGIFPKEAFLPTYSSFREHFQAQINSGHSACFGRNFELCR